MSKSYSSQFDSSFTPTRLQNWCVAKTSKPKIPAARGGPTSVIADDRGHLLPGVNRGNVWPNFKRSWDLPAPIPIKINPTARSGEGLKRLNKWGYCPPQSGKSLPHEDGRTTDVGEQVSRDAPTSTDEPKESSQELTSPAKDIDRNPEPVL